MANDGSITLGIKIDTKGADTDVQKLANKYKAATLELEKQTKKVDELKKHLVALESGSANVTGKGITKLQAELDKATASAQKTKNEITELYNHLDIMQSSAMKAPGTGEPMLAQSEQADFENTNIKLDELENKLSTSQTAAAGLKAQLSEAVGAATQAEINKTNEQLNTAEVKLDEVKIKAQQAGEKLKNCAQNSQTGAAAASAAFEKLGTKIFAMAKRVFVFSMITKALRAVRSTLTAVIASDDEFQNSLNRLKAAFWVAYAPINDFVVPILKKLIDWTTKAVTAVTKLFAMLSGKSYSDMVGQGKSLNSKVQQNTKKSDKTEKSPEEKAIENQIKALEKENKELSKQKKLKQKMQKAQEKANKRSLADFDELSILTEQRDESETEALDDKIEANNEIIDQLQEQLDLINEQKAAAKADDETQQNNPDFNGLEAASEGIQTTLTIIMKAAGAALVAVGLILLFTGNIAWGIGFIIAGATIFGVAEAAEQSGSGVGEVISNFLTENAALITGLSIGMLVIGVLLVCFGHVTPMSIGLIVAGAVGLAAEVAVNANAIGNAITSFFAQNAALIVGVSTAMLVLGVILCMTASIPIGVGLIIAGVTGLAATVALNWGIISSYITSFFAQNAALIVGVSTSLLVLGIILCMTANIPLGIGLIAVGVIGIAAEIALNWGIISSYITSFFAQNAALIVGVSTALIVMGVILCVSGAAIPLGIGLIIIGLAGMVTEAALNWGTISTSISTFINNNSGLIIGVSIGILVLGVLLCVSGAAIPLGIGMIIAGAAGLVTAATVNWGTLTSQVGTELQRLMAIAAAASFAIGVVLLLTGNIGMGIALIAAGAASAFGALSIGSNSLESGGLQSQLSGEMDKVNSAAEEGVNKVDATLNSLGKDTNQWSTRINDNMNKAVQSAGKGVNALEKTMANVQTPSYVDVNYSVSSLRVPHLAQGAVIPPNKEFLAVLGDQTSGTNVEAPLSTIKQAVSEVFATMGGAGVGNQQIVLEIDGRELGRSSISQSQREMSRVGTSILAT